MPRPDYAFLGPYRYEVNARKYDKHRSYDYLEFQYNPSLLKLLRHMHVLSRPGRRLLWIRVAKKNSKPVIRVDVRNYESPHTGARAEFLLDTGADVSILTVETADSLGIDRSPRGDPVIVGGIGGTKFVGLPRWIYMFLGGKLHPIPVLVPPEDNQTGKLQSIRLKKNILGRAAITSCFLMCFDNKRLYAFARRTSESGMR